MKDIKLNTLFMKIQYWVSWVGFIVFGFGIVWFIAIILGTYGKTTDLDVKRKKDILNKTWQKFVFIYGSIVGDIFLVALVIDLIQMQFTGHPL